MFFYNFFYFLDFFWIFFFFFAATIPLEQYPSSVAENAWNFTSSCSWRRRFNNNNNSKQCCFKNQRWQNNPFSYKSKQKSWHFVPVSEWWVWQCLSWETFLPTAPCQRPPLTQARVSVGLDRFFFAVDYSGTKNRTRVVVNRVGTQAFDYTSQPYYVVNGVIAKLPTSWTTTIPTHEFKSLNTS